MFDQQVVAVVVPAYREAAHIEAVLAGMPAFVDHVVVVDDASDDDTADRADRAAARDRRVEVVRRTSNGGPGAARVTGHRRALELGADVVVVMDGDGQMDPAHLDALLEPVTSGGYGFAKANRFFSATSYTGMPTVRVAGNIALTFLTKASSGYWNLVDPQNGYTAIRADVLRRLDLDRLSGRYDFENDLLVWLNILDVPATDVPIPAVYGSETSHLKIWRDGPRIGLTLLRGFWRRIWRKYILWSFSPIALLLLSGLALLAGSAVFTAAAAAMVDPTRPLPTATVLLAVVPGLMGFQLLVQALVLDIQATPRRPSPPTHPHTG